MKFFKKLAQVFSPPPVETPVYWIRARCNRCGEVIQTRVNLHNDLSLDYAESGEASYVCRKLLIGEGHCFQRLEVELTFDANRKLTNRTITGGVFVEE